MLTVKTAANLLGVSQNHIRNLIKTKKLRAAQVGAHKMPAYRIAESDLIKFIRAAKRLAGVKTPAHENVEKKAAEKVENVKKVPPGVGSFENGGFRRGAAAGSHTSAISTNPPHNTTPPTTLNPYDIND